MTCPYSASEDQQSEQRLFRFDMFFDPLTEADAHLGHMRLHQLAPDVFWTPCNGGLWVATRYADVTTIMRTPEIFSSEHIALATGDERMPFPLPPQDMDPPDHLPHRLLLRQFLSPTRIRALEPGIRHIVASQLDALQGRNRCEFLREVAMPVAARTFMAMMELDETSAAELIPCVDQLLRGTDFGEIVEAMGILKAFSSQAVAERIDRPGEDPISVLLRSELGGQPLSRDRVEGMVTMLIVAGLDTVQTALTFFMNHLAQHAALQQQLKDDPTSIPRAVEELLRRFSFLNLPRRVTRDVELGGVTLRAGETIVCSLGGASNDEREFDDPEQVDFKRPPSRHLAFGTGPHTCAGASLARSELRIFLEQWFSQMPTVQHAPGFIPAPRGGTVMALQELQLVW